MLNVDISNLKFFFYLYLPIKANKVVITKKNIENCHLISFMIDQEKERARGKKEKKKRRRRIYIYI